MSNVTDDNKLSVFISHRHIDKPLADAFCEAFAPRIDEDKIKQRAREARYF